MPCPTLFGGYVERLLKPKYYAYIQNKACIFVPGDISITDSRFGRHHECWSYAKFSKVANTWFENYRPKQTFWYKITNVVLRRQLTPICRPLMQSYLLHYYEINNQIHIYNLQMILFCFYLVTVIERCIRLNAVCFMHSAYLAIWFPCSILLLNWKYVWLKRVQSISSNACKWFT